MCGGGGTFHWHDNATPPNVYVFSTDEGYYKTYEDTVSAGNMQMVMNFPVPPKSVNELIVTREPDGTHVGELGRSLRSSTTKGAKRWKVKPLMFLIII